MECRNLSSAFKQYSQCSKYAVLCYWINLPFHANNMWLLFSQSLTVFWSVTLCTVSPSVNSVNAHVLCLPADNRVIGRPLPSGLLEAERQTNLQSIWAMYCTLLLANNDWVMEMYVVLGYSRHHICFDDFLQTKQRQQVHIVLLEFILHVISFKQNNTFIAFHLAFPHVPSSTYCLGFGQLVVLFPFEH